MAIIGKSENDDFRKAINDLGLDPDDFSIQEEQDPVSASGVAPVTGRVTVQRKSTGIERTYEAGHGTSWAASFEDDLRRGVFGRE